MYLYAPNGVVKVYPYSIGQLMKDNPQVSFPKPAPDELLASYGVFPYTRPTQPDHNPLTSTAVDGSFEQDSAGNWVLPWAVKQIPADRASFNVRSERDDLLSQTDWIVAVSYERGEPVPQAWVSYRQALRDIPDQQGFPYEVTWPAKPE